MITVWELLRNELGRGVVNATCKPLQFLLSQQQDYSPPPLSRLVSLAHSAGKGPTLAYGIEQKRYLAVCDMREK